MNKTRQKEIIELLNHPLFNITNPSSLDLYDQALTHSSYAKEQADKEIECPDYERLEFLGNFVLGLVVSEYLFEHFDQSPGEMTKRMEVVSDAKLAEMIKSRHPAFGTKYLRLGNRERGRMHNTGVQASILACAFEAIIGAIYLDQGLEKAREVTLGLLEPEIIDFDLEKNYIGRLQELVQKNKLGELKYIEKRLTGPDHKPTFQASAKISGKIYGKGVGGNKRAAKMKAARAALKRLES